MKMIALLFMTLLAVAACSQTYHPSFTPLVEDGTSQP